MPKKIRLDSILVERGLAPNLDLAARLIMAGEIYVNEERALSPGSMVAKDSAIRLAERAPYVSRGGEKLKGAIDHFGIKIKGQIALDVGASTGGFTDCLLKEGAVKVFAVDVGTNELDWKLRNDPRVVNLAGINAKSLNQVERSIFSPAPSFVTVDVSFISVTQILPAIKDVLNEGARLLILVKPQFELAREQVESGGVVTSKELQEEACRKVEKFAESIGFKVLGRRASQLRGLKKGNQEYFVYLDSKGLK